MRQIFGFFWYGDPIPVVIVSTHPAIEKDQIRLPLSHLPQCSAGSSEPFKEEDLCLPQKDRITLIILTF